MLGSVALKALTANILHEKFLYKFRDDKKLNLQSFSSKVHMEYNMCPDRWRLSKARKASFLQIHGDEKDSSVSYWGKDPRRSGDHNEHLVTY
jgi:hypothetical protein